jgi:DNA-binding NarL/FixJ family response regulator
VIRVLVVSRSARAGLEAALRAEPDIEVASGAEDADVIVLDWDRAEEPELPAGPAPVVVLARETGLTREALRGGARAVLPREAGREEMAAAIRAAAGGLIALAPEAVEALLAPAARAATAPAVEELTPREIEVLRMMAEGDGNKEIAFRLGISEHTVKFHVASILGKMGASSRTEAVTAGIRRGVILI